MKLTRCDDGKELHLEATRPWWEFLVLLWVGACLGFVPAAILGALDVLQSPVCESAILNQKIDRDLAKEWRHSAETWRGYYEETKRQLDQCRRVVK